MPDPRKQAPALFSTMNSKNAARTLRALQNVSDAIKSLGGLPPGPTKAVLIKELERIRRGIYHGLPEDYPKGSTS